jgi:hypothetical protein
MKEHRMQIWKAFSIVPKKIHNTRFSTFFFKNHHQSQYYYAIVCLACYLGCHYRRFQRGLRMANPNQGATQRPQSK